MYTPPNYNPFKAPPAEPELPETLKQAARFAGGEYIHKDGLHCYKWLFNDMYYANAPDFESWFPVMGDLPAGELIEL